MNRNFVTAKFRFVPLGFFENTTGKLRFLEQEGAMEGRELEPGAWMVTVGEGLMVASSTAWMFKHLSLNDWMNCSERNGTPALVAISAAAQGSANWLAMEQALADLLEGKSVVHSNGESIEVLNKMGTGTMPFPQLVERIDRMLAALWRGADLSTISRDRGYGASLQEKETCALEEDDAEMLTETLNRYVDEWVIRHVFGEGVRPLAGVKVLVSPRECTTADLQIDEFLIGHGAPLSIRETMTRYGRALPEAGEKVFAIESGKESKPTTAHVHSGNMENESADCGPAVSFGFADRGGARRGENRRRIGQPIHALAGGVGAVVPVRRFSAQPRSAAGGSRRSGGDGRAVQLVPRPARASVRWRAVLCGPSGPAEQQ